MDRSNLRYLGVISLTTFLTIGLAIACNGQNMAGSQVLVDNEHTLDRMASKIKPFEDLAAACRTNSCPSIDCRTAQSLYQELINARQLMRHEYFWMSRGAEELEQTLNGLSRAQYRDDASFERARFQTDYRLTMARRARNKAHAILDRLTKLVVGTGDGSLITCLAKLSSHCTALNLNSGSTIIIPQPARVVSFDDVSEIDRAKNWSRAIANLQPIIAAKTKTLPPLIRTGVALVRPTLRIRRTSVRRGEYVVVQFTASPCLSANAWAGVVTSTISHGNEQLNADNIRSDRELIRHRTSGSLRFAAPNIVGSYDIRLNDGDGNEIASIPFRVIGGDTPPRMVTPMPTNTNVLDGVETALELRERKAKEINWQRRGYIENEPPNEFLQATYYCIPFDGNAGWVVGDEVYHDYSSICPAAVHFGVITKAKGGWVTIQRRPDLGIYSSAVRNGVTSQTNGFSGSAFFFVTKDAGRNRELQARVATRTARWREGIPEFWLGDSRMPYKRMSYLCPANGPKDNDVWGTNVYSGRSSVCLAAVHAGLITLSAGGKVTFEVHPTLKQYHGSERNGIKSSDMGEWSSSFVFVRP